MAQTFSDDELQHKLTPEQFHVLREQGTEAPFSGALLHNKERGAYTCAACGNVVFRSDHKFDSGSGWPSFYQAAAEGAVTLRIDTTAGMRRTEVRCAVCGSHLGHVFDDAPATPTGQRFCINSAALSFSKKE